MTVVAPLEKPAGRVERAPRASWSALLRLVRFGVREHRSAPLIWGGGLAAASALFVALWPSISGSMGKLLESYPDSIKQAFGVVSLDTVERYLDAELLTLIMPFALTVLAVRCVTGPTVVAEAANRLDTTLSLPISRRVLAAAAWIVAGVVVAAALALVWVVTLATGLVLGVEVSATVLGRGLVNVWPPVMVFAGVALLTAGAAPGAGRATGAALGVALAAYVADVVGKLSPDADWLRSVSVFRYYGSAVRDGLDATHLLLLVAVAIALAAAGCELFQRRDLG